MIKNFLLTIGFIMTIGSNCSSQTKDEKIQEIRTMFAEIESAISKKEYNATSKSFEHPDDYEYGTVTIFKDDDKVKKIVVESIVNEENTQIWSYYVSDNALFFSFHESKAPRMLNEREMEFHHTEKRFYFFENEAIKCLEKIFVSNPDIGNENSTSANTPNNEILCDEAKLVQIRFNDILKETE